MTIPEHIKEVPTAEPNDREAYAPYNFVPLPETVVEAEDVPTEYRTKYQKLPRQDLYISGRHHGQIVCTLTTESPLYVRCGYTPTAYADYGDRPFHELSPEQQRERARFFAHDDPIVPVIPGSSLRGMLRSLVEIAGYGKMDRVMDRQLFYRSVSDSNYQQLFVEKPDQVQVAPHPRAQRFRSKVRAGFLRLKGGAYVIEECPVARIDHYANNPRGLAAIPPINGKKLMDGSGPGQTPNWVYQHQRIYVHCDPSEQDYFFKAQFDKAGKQRHPDQYLRFRGVRQASFRASDLPGAQESTLVVTGHMQNKHMEFVFLHSTTATHIIDRKMIERFEDEDQVTQWQEGAFRRDSPTSGARRHDGLLRDGEPVFFLLQDDGSVRFFGRAQLFRLPYGTAPYNFLPQPHHSSQVVDLAEALFGFVRDKAQPDGVPQMAAGRVFVSDGQFISARGNVWLSEDPLTPRILSSPKPTTYQHYLVQPEQTKAGERSLRRYDNDTKSTTLRGHKLYWHKGAVAADKITEVDQGKLQSARKQYTQFQPVASGVTFSFVLHFENLSDVELGALLWVLRLGDDAWQGAPERKRGPYRLKLGMGKPLGMGAVSIRYDLRLSDRDNRYHSLFDGDKWAEPTPPNTAIVTERAFATFEGYVLGASGEMAKQITDLHQTLRIRCLLALLSWPGPNPPATRYMEIERDEGHQEGHRPGRVRNGKVNEYGNRLVLPQPLQVLNEHPAPRPKAPPVQRKRIEIGLELTGNRKGEIATPFGKGVLVQLNLRDYELPKGKEFVGVIRRQDASGGSSGGFRGTLVEIEVDKAIVYLFLKPAPKPRDGQP